MNRTKNTQGLIRTYGFLVFALLLLVELPVVNAHVVISSGATVTMGSGAKAYLSGNWTNNGTFNAGNGTVILNGSATQTVTNNSTGSFNNLTISKSGGDVVIQGTVTVKNTLTLSSGNVVATSGTFKLGQNSEGILVRSSGTIIGAFTRDIGTSIGSRLFPLGTFTSYRPLTVNFTSAPTSGGELLVSHVDGGVGFVVLSQTVTDTTTNPAYIVEYRSQMYWNLSGGVSGGLCDLSIDANGQQGITDPENLRAVHSPDGSSLDFVGAHSSGSGTTANRSSISGAPSGQFYVGKGTVSSGGSGSPPNTPIVASLGPTVVFIGDTDILFSAYTFDPDGDQVRFGFEGWWTGTQYTDWVNSLELTFYAPPSPSSPGGYTVWVRAYDSAGNVSGSRNFEFFVHTPGTPVTLPLGFDESISVSLSPSFTFYGQAYTSVWVNSHGNLTFGAGEPSGYIEDPDGFRNGLPRIAGWWDDLDPRGGSVTYTSHPDRTVIAFDSIPETGAANANSFTITLFNSGTIELGGYDIDAQDGLVGISPGGGATGNAVDLNTANGTYSGAIYEVFAYPNDLARVTFTPQGSNSYKVEGVGSGALVAYTLDYTILDNPSTIDRRGINGNRKSMEVEYDDLSRVIQVEYDEGEIVDIVKFYYGDDLDDSRGKVGNRTKKTSTLDGATTYSYAANSNQLTYRSVAPDHAPGHTDPLSYSYDAEGNLASKFYIGNNNKHAFTFDAAGRLRQIQRYNSAGTLAETISYAYDGDGNRVKVTDNSGTRYFLYSGSKKLLELDANKSVTAYYLHGADGMVYRRKVATDAYEYHHKDWLGGTTLITDQSRNVIASYYYNVFGSPRWTYDPTGSDDNTHKFTGKEFDEKVNLYYYGARYYDPYVGRFISRDPAHDGTNWYVYVRNNPLALVDPTGQSPETAIDLAQFIQDYSN